VALAPRSLSVSARGSHVATTDANGFVDVFDATTLRLTTRIRLAGGRPGGVALAPDGRTLAAVSGAGELGFFDSRSGRRSSPWMPAATDLGVAMSFSAAGRWIATGGSGGVVRLWDARRRRLAQTVVRAAVDVDLSPDGKLLAATLRERNFNGNLELYSVPDLKLVRTVKLPAGAGGLLRRWTAPGLLRPAGPDLDGRHPHLDPARGPDPTPGRARLGRARPDRPARRLRVGRAPVVVVAARLRRGRPRAQPARVGPGAARAPVRARMRLSRRSASQNPHRTSPLPSRPGAMVPH
jgi:WD40 repeat protein